jgi:hypothetical protein
MPYIITFLLYVFTIVQQPQGNPLYVSPDAGVVTQHSGIYCGGKDIPAYGFLAHGEQAGQYFGELQKDDLIAVKFEAKVLYFRVSEVRRYYALDPYKNTSPLKNIETGITEMDAYKLGGQIYCNPARRLVLQTCFDGVKGRMFIIADLLFEDDRGHR